LTASNDNTVRVWNMRTGGMIHQFSGNRGEFSPDGKTAAVALKNEAIEVYEMGTGDCRTKMVGHHNGVTTLAYSADGQFLLSGGNDEAVRIWDVRTGKAVRSFRLVEGQIPLCVAFGEDGRQIVVVTDSQLSLWDVASGVRVSSTKVAVGDQRLALAVLSSDAHRLFCAEPGKPIAVYDVPSGKSIGVLPKEPGPVKHLAISPDGTRVLLGLENSNDLILRELVITPQ
jgi:WD40 repeat protein